MARNLFGGSAADVAEDIDGGRIPGAVGTVWNGPSEDAVQINDLTDKEGSPIIQLVADNRGVIPAFYGPTDDTERLWVDFGVGKVSLTSVTVGDRLQNHIKANDPHHSNAYTDQQIQTVLPKSGGEVNSLEGVNWLGVNVPLQVDPIGNVLVLKTAGGNYTRISNSGAVFIDTLDSRPALCVGAPGYAADQATFNITNAKATGSIAQSLFRVMGDGSVHASGTVSASNVGSNRVFSGPNPPSGPVAGDVWIKYV